MTTVFIEDSSPQAKLLVTYVRGLPFVKVENGKRMTSNFSAVKRVLENVPEGILAEITDPVSYQKAIRDEWN